MTTGTCYLIYCSTGCTCCNDQNHYRGPFSTKEIAEERCKSYSRSRILSSQYSDNGNYTITPASFEQLSDGRLIIDDTRIASGFKDDEYDDEYAHDRY